MSITDSDNIERARVSLDVEEGTHTTSVATLGDHSKLSDLELDEVNNLASGNVNLDGVIDLDKRIRVSDGAAIMSDDVRDLLAGKLLTLHLAELELLLLITDAVEDIATLGVEDKAELEVSLRNLDNIHETSREVRISADLAINLDVLLNADDLGLLASQSILESVSQDKDERQRLTELVRSLGRTRRLKFPSSSKFH